MFKLISFIHLHIFFLLWISLSVHIWAQSPEKSEKYIQSIIDESGIKGALWSVSVRNESGREIVALNSDMLLTPASNMKLLSSYALMNFLPLDYRITTQVYTRGSIRSDTLFGDVIVEGRGDPGFNALHFSDEFDVFNRISEALKKRGIRVITGDIIGLVGAFNHEPYPKGWEWNDLHFYYAVENTALAWNQNTVRLISTGAQNVSATPAIDWSPFRTDYVNFENEQTTVAVDQPYREYYYRMPGTNTILLRSEIPINYVEKEDLSVQSGNRFFLYVMKQVLEKKYHSVLGEVRVLDKAYPIGADTLFALQGDQWLSYIHQINKKSNNFYTEMLIRHAVWKQTGEGASFESGINFITSSLVEAGIDTSRIKITDASGMSASNKLRSSDLSFLLYHIFRSEMFVPYQATLSQSGGSGTLSNRFFGRKWRTRLWGKSGYISGVRALSGYLITEEGERLSFSMITNNFLEKTRNVDRVHEQILDYLNALR